MKLQLSWRRIAALDPRSLILFRTLFGILLCFDFTNSLYLVRVFYSSAGVFPAKLLGGSEFPPWYFRSFFLSDHWLWSSGLLIFMLLLSIAFAVGFRPRLCAFILWLLVCGYQMRNPWVLHGGDTITRVFLFWSIFLPFPKGFHWNRQQTEASVSTFLIPFQLSIVYFFTFLLKSDPIWRSKGTAINYALQLSLFTRWPAEILLDYPSLCRILSLLTVYWELVGPILLFCPFFFAPIRCLVIFGFVFFHLSLNVFMNIGLFGYLCSTFWLALLPSEFYDYFKSKIPQTLRAPPQFVAHFFKRILSILPSLKFSLPNFDIPDVSAAHKKHLDLLKNASICFFIGITVIANLDQFPKSKGFPAWIGNTIWKLGLHQNWGMFAPYPKTNNGYVVIVGQFRNGAIANLMNPTEPLHFNLPENYSTLTGTPWKKYLERLENSPENNLRLYFARYLCREYRDPQTPALDLISLQMYYISRNSAPPGSPPLNPTYITWIDHECFRRRNFL